MEFSEGLSKQQKISEIMRNSNLSATEKQNQIALILSDGERLPEEEVIECTHYSNEDKKCGKCFFECCQKYDNCHRYTYYLCIFMVIIIIFLACVIGSLCILCTLAQMP